MILVPAYFAPISYFKHIINQNEVLFSTNTKYQKQTYRNRCIICGSNGLQKLIIPITHSRDRKNDKDVMIYNKIPWQKNHWKSIETAYKSSPFYEYYCEDLKDFFTEKYKYLFDLNIAIMIQIFNLLDHSMNINETNCEINLIKINQILDPKKDLLETKQYNQVFQNKIGFQSDLSIIDVLFNLGPETLDYIKKI